MTNEENQKKFETIMLINCWGIFFILAMFVFLNILVLFGGYQQKLECKPKEKPPSLQHREVTQNEYI